nr:MAG TPA: hypothetical protein [Caudoviricetes sp.]
MLFKDDFFGIFAPLFIFYSFFKFILIDLFIFCEYNSLIKIIFGNNYRT